MKTLWILIEVIAVFIDGITKVYFLNSHFVSRYGTKTPELLTWLCLFIWGLFATFFDFSTLLYVVATYSIVLSYLFLTKEGSHIQKLFGMVLTLALTICCSLSGAGLASLIMSTRVENTLVYQSSSRLLAIILIKTIQTILFFLLARRRYHLQSLQKKPIIILIFTVIMIFLCLIFMFLNLSNFNEKTNHLLIWLSVGLLIVLIGIFFMYEMFIKEEIRNIELTRNLQRLELESQFFKELDAMYTDLRRWQHEYKNNLIALQALVENDSPEKALKYIEKISGESLREYDLLQTGNLVLDAVVSSKLMIARSSGIKVSVQAVYPEINNIDENDLCAIAGNLLDNAIEACNRMVGSEQPRFISFSLLTKGKNLVISIINSYGGEIKRAGNKLLTVKNDPHHGIGIQYVDLIVDKYQGHVLREYTDEVFETHVMLPLVTENKK